MIELPPLPAYHFNLHRCEYRQIEPHHGEQPECYMIEDVEARERILQARIAELEAQRDFLVDEYERAVKCGKQGYLHCAMHLFNAIANARIDAIIAAREKKE